jgi:allophanate hydrolase
MARAVLAVTLAGPLVTVQDAGRPGLMRFGVPASGPMDRTSFAVANAALGNPLAAPGIEISIGGLSLECVEGEVSLACTGGGFHLEIDGTALGSWAVASLKAGSRLTIRPGFWGSWAYLALAGRLQASAWLGSLATHGPSGFGGGRLVPGRMLVIEGAELREGREGPIRSPVTARPRQSVRVVLGPQDRFFAPATVERLVSEPFALTTAYDRMGVRLHGPPLPVAAKLDMPSEPIARGSIQVSGDGVATVLLADHQTTGGYPKIATMIGDDLDGFVQLRSRQTVTFRRVSPAQAIEAARTRARVFADYLAQF